MNIIRVLMTLLRLVDGAPAPRLRLIPDVVLAGEPLPIKVKATAKPCLADCAHLRTFQQEYGRKARAGLLLHTGRTVEWLTPDVLAVPWWRVL